MGTMILGRQQFAVSGRIDRLAVDGEKVILVDYKTNRCPAAQRERNTLCPYRAARNLREILAPLYPGKEFVCALIYTENAAFIEVGNDAMRDALAAIKTK